MGLKSTTVCLGYQQITSLSTSTGLTVPSGATLAVIVPEVQPVRWRDDGIDPTSTLGMPLGVDTVLSYDGDLHQIRFIQQTASSAINVSYYA